MARDKTLTPVDHNKKNWVVTIYPSRGWEVLGQFDLMNMTQAQAEGQAEFINHTMFRGATYTLIPGEPYRYAQKSDIEHEQELAA